MSVQRTFGFVLLAVASAAAQPVTLEDGFVRLTVDRQGGAVTSMHCKLAMTVPLITGKGAGVAAEGRLFVPRVTLNGQVVDLAAVPMALERMKTAQGETVVVLSVNPAPGLAFRRVLRLGEQESGVRIQDTYRNSGGRALRFRAGASSRQHRPAWLLVQRSWFGDAGQSVLQQIPGESGLPARRASSADWFYWRVIGQYGTGFLYQVRPLRGPVELEQAYPNEPGVAARFDWQAAEVALPSGAALTIDSSVLIDEGGAPGRHENVASRLLVEADLAAAGRTGARLRGFANVTSPLPRRVTLVVTQGGGNKTVLSAKLSLRPGKNASVPFTVTPAKQGWLHVEAAVFDEAGRKLAASPARAVIDGEGMGGEAGEIWKLYTRRMPKEIYRGSWEEIGAQLVTNPNRIGSPTSVTLNKRDEFDTASAALLAFYERRFPFYAEMLRGAAKALGLGPVQLVFRDVPERGREACMDVAFFGPDGPINAFSKERSGSGLNGLGYVKVVPAKGYAFHTYMNYGVNSEGLSTSGATLNEDEETYARGTHAAAEWRRAGKPMMPRPTWVWMWMILSMVRNVDEALALLDDPDVPVEVTGNFLLLDRAGNAARVESAGIYRQIFCYNPKEEGFFVAGNYSHERADGLFRISKRWQWAANTMLREKFLWEVAGKRRDRISLDDAFTLMQTHGPGGMCQHIHDNVGLLHSSCSSIAVTGTTDLWLSHGPPCQVEYVRYTLKD